MLLCPTGVPLRIYFRPTARRRKRQLWNFGRFPTVTRVELAARGASNTALGESNMDLEAQTNEGNGSIYSKALGVGAQALRAAQVYGIAALMYGDYRVTGARAQLAKRIEGLNLGEESDDHPSIKKYWDSVHERNSWRLLKGMRTLRGFWVKVGQFLSSRPDIMPLPYLKQLKQLQDCVPNRPWKEVEATLEEELGCSWHDSFDWVDKTPLSTASVAQVHLAKLRNGDKVVLKVVHRGIDALVRSDLENLRILCEMMAKQNPDYDFRKIVNEWIPAVREEVDLRIEARNLHETAKNMENAGVRVILPRPVDDLITRKVLVMQYCPGFSIRNVDKFEERRVNREVVLARVCEAWAVQMHVNGFYNADPHPGNILISTCPEQNGGDPSVPILLDFGLTRRFSESMKLAFSKMMHSTYVLDVDGLLTSFDEMGIKIGIEDPFEDLKTMRNVFKTVPASKAKAVRDENKKERKLKEEQVARVKRPIDAWPGDLVFFFRVTGLLKGLCSTLEMEFPYLQTMAESARKTVEASYPKEDHATTVLYPVPCSPNVNKRLQQQIEELVEALREKDELLGLQVVVLQRNKVVANVAAGRLGPVDPRPVSPSTIFNVFSVTKAFAAAAVHILAQRKLIEYDDHVSKYWPQFAASGKGSCTIRHALNHQAGLADALPDNATLGDLLDWNNMVDFVGSSNPSHVPGEQSEYHYLTFGWILGGIVKGVTGKEIYEFMTEEISKTLGLEDQLFLGGIPGDLKHDRLAVLQLGRTSSRNEGILDNSSQNGLSSNTDDVASKDGQNPRWERFKGREQMLNPTTFNMMRVRKACIPSANGHMSAWALAHFYGSFGGTTDQTISPILSLETIAMCISDMNNRLNKPSRSKQSEVFQATPDAPRALGFQGFEFLRADGSTVVGLGHSGLGGSLGFSIPDEQVSVGITVSSLSFSRATTKQIVGLICKNMGLRPPVSMME